MTKHLLIAVVLVGMIGPPMALPVQAQDAAPGEFIAVVGSGRAFAAVDVAHIGFDIRTVGPASDDPFATHQATMSAVIGAVQEAGGEDVTIAVGDLSLFSSTFDVREYDITYGLTVTLRDTSQVNNVVQAAVEAGATNVFAFNLDVADMEAAEREARELALADASTSAQQYAALLDVELGRIITITESNVSSDTFNTRASVTAQDAADLNFGQVPVVVDLYVTYAINR